MSIIETEVHAGLIAEVQARADAVIEKYAPTPNIILLALELASADAALHAVGVGGEIAICGQTVKVGR